MNTAIICIALLIISEYCRVGAYPANGPPIPIPATYVFPRAYQQPISINGTYFKNIMNITIGGVQCLPFSSSFSSTNTTGLYQPVTQPCRINQTRDQACTNQVRKVWGLQVTTVGNCESPSRTEPCSNNAYSSGYESYDPSCVPLSRKNSCFMITCGYTGYGCVQFGFGGSKYNIPNVGVQCGLDTYSYCNSSGICDDARAHECPAVVTCVPPDLPVGVYDIIIATATGVATMNASYAVVDIPVVIAANTSVASVNFSGVAETFLLVSPEALIDIAFAPTNDTIVSLYLWDGTPFMNRIPYTSTYAAQPIAMNATRVGLQFIDAKYGRAFNVSVTFPLMYVKRPQLFSLCPGLALAYTSTTVVVLGDFFYNYSSATTPAGNAKCRFGDIFVPMIMINKGMARCVVAPTNATAGVVPLTISNDGGDTYASQSLMVNVLGSCPSLKPNSVPIGSQCTCPAGFEDVGYACIPCAIGTYQSAVGQQQCIPCDATQTTRAIQSTSAAACVCKDGFYRSSATENACLACPAGMSCMNGTTYLLPGYWRSSASSLLAIPCPGGTRACIGERGMGGLPLLGGLGGLPPCGDGYEGPLCQVCAPGYGRIGIDCVQCRGSEKDGALFAFMIIVGIALVYALVRLTSKSEDYSTLVAGGESGGSVAIIGKIFFSYAQVLYYIGNLSVNWSNQTVSFFNVFVPVAISPQFVAIQCAAPLGFYSRMIMVMCLPIIVATALFLSFFACFMIGCWGPVCAAFMLRHFNISNDAYVRTLLVILYLIHPMISHEVLMALRCTSIPGTDERFVSTDMSVSCTTPKYHVFQAVAATFIIGYVLGLPVMIGKNVWDTREEISVMLTRGWLHAEASRYIYFARGYKTDAILWEGVILFRKLAIVVTSLFQNVMLQLTWSGVIIVWSLIATIHMRPYRMITDNRLDLIALSALATSVLLGLHVAIIGENANMGVFACMVIVNTAAVAFMIGACFKRLRRVGTVALAFFAGLYKSFMEWRWRKGIVRGGANEAEMGSESGPGAGIVMYERGKPRPPPPVAVRLQPLTSAGSGGNGAKIVDVDGWGGDHQ